MKVAVISFDIKYVEMLSQNMSGINIIPYGDTISFLKESETQKPDIVIYDTTSGIFAEDDLKYLLHKNIVEDKKIFGLTSPDNYIDTTSFEGRVIFFDKNKDLQNLMATILSLASDTKKQEAETDSFEQHGFDEGEPYTEIKEFAEKETTDIGFIEFDNLTEISEAQPVSVKEPSFELESFHVEDGIGTFKEEDFENLPGDLMIESDLIEPSSYDVYQEPSDIEELPLHMELTSVETEPFSEAEIPEVPSETFEQSQNDYLLEDITVSEDTKKVEEEPLSLETIPVETQPVSEVEIQEITETVPQNQDTYPLTEKITGLGESEKYRYIAPKYTESSDETLSGKKINLGGEGMIANFNIQISEDEVKALALTVAREFLEKDPSMEKIVDHLQIDFQEEARKELDDIKNQLKEQLKAEAEVVMRQEIERLIKEELKDYVADITAKIVKEKLDQIFKSF